MRYVCLGGEINQVVMQLVHHHQPEVFPALLEGGPIEFTQHRFHTGCIMVAVEGESCCSPLHHYELMDGFVGRWVPYSGTVFHKWSDEGFVGGCFQVR